MGLAPNFATVFVGDSIGCEVPDPIFSQPLCVWPKRSHHRSTPVIEMSHDREGVPGVRGKTSVECE